MNFDELVALVQRQVERKIQRGDLPMQEIKQEIIGSGDIDPNELLLPNMIGYPLLDVAIKKAIENLVAADAGLAAAIAAMPGSFPADSIDPSKVNVTTNSVFDFTVYTFNSATYSQIGTTYTVPTPGVYFITAAIQLAYLAGVVNDLYTYRGMVDGASIGTDYVRCVNALDTNKLLINYVGPVNTNFLVEANRFSGTGTGRTNQYILRAARIG